MTSREAGLYGQAFDVDMDTWRQEAAGAAASVAGVLSEFGGEDGFRWSESAERAVDRVYGYDDADMFWSSLKAAEAAGISPERMSEVMVQLRERLATANLSDAGEFVITVSSQPGADGQMSSAELAHALGMLPFAREIFHTPGADALLAAAPTAKEFAAAAAAIPQAMTDILDLPSVAAAAVAAREACMNDFVEGRLSFEQFAEGFQAANSAALEEWDEKVAQVEAALARLPAVSEQHETLHRSFEHSQRVAPPLTATMIASEQEALSAVSENIDRLSTRIAEQLFFKHDTRNPRWEYVSTEDMDPALPQLTRAAADAAHAIMVEDAASGPGRLPYQEVVERTVAALSARADLPAVSYPDYGEICASTVSTLRSSQAWAAVDRDDLFDQEMAARQEERGFSPRYAGVSPQDLIGHVETFVDRLQPPSMSGNADASRKMAKLMLSAAARSAEEVEWTRWNTQAAGQEGSRPVRGTQAQTLDVVLAADEQTRRFASESLPLIHSGNGPYKGISATPVVAALAPHLDDERLAYLASKMDLSSGWEERSAASLAERFHMSGKDAAEHVGRLSSRIRSVLER